MNVFLFATPETDDVYLSLCFLDCRFPGCTRAKLERSDGWTTKSQVVLSVIHVHGFLLRKKLGDWSWDLVIIVNALCFHVTSYHGHSAELKQPRRPRKQGPRVTTDSVRKKKKKKESNQNIIFHVMSWFIHLVQILVILTQQRADSIR